MQADPNLNFDIEMYGQIVAWGTIGMVTGKLLNGIVADWLGGKTVFIAALISTAALGITFSFGTTFAYFASVNFIMLFCAAAGWPAMANIISAWYPQNKLGRVWGIVSTSSRLSALLSPLFLGALLAHFQWKYVFCAAGAGGAIIGVLIFFLLKARPQDVGLGKPSEIEPEDPNDSEKETKAHFLDDKDLSGALWAFAKSGRFWLMCLSLMCTTVLMEFITFIPLFLKSFGVSISQSAMSSSVFPAGCFIALIGGGFLYDKVTRKGRIGLLGGLLVITCLCVSVLWVLLDPGLTGHTSPVNSVAFSSNGKVIVSASNDKTVRLWDSSTKSLSATLTDHTDSVNSVAFSPDSKMIASASADKTVRLWDSSGKLMKTLTDHTDSVNSVAFSPDDKMIASASADKTVRLWDSSGKLITTLSDHTDGVNSVAFSSDGKMIASASADKTVKLWDSSGKLITTLTDHTDGVNSVAFSPDGTMIASASADKTVRLWDNSGKLITTFTDHTNNVNSVVFSPDSKFIASASNDDTVILWDSSNNEPSVILAGHTNQVNSVAFSPDGKTTASASSDTSVRLWESKRWENPTNETSSKFYIVVLVLFFFGLTVAPAYYLPMSIFSNEFGGKYCGLLIGVIDATGYAAAAIYQFLGGGLVKNHGWIAMFALFFIISIVAIIITCWFAFEDYRGSNKA